MTPESEVGFDAVHADTLRFFPELVRELGGDPATLAADVGVDLSSAVPTGYRARALLLEHAAAQLRCFDFGLRLAMRQGGNRVFGALGAVMRHAETFGAGLRYVVANSHAHSLAARMRMEHEPAERSALVSHEILVEHLPIKRQLVEQLLLLGQLNALEISGGRACVRAVRFRFSAVSPQRTYERYFGCEVRFDQAIDGVVFDTAALEARPLQADPARCAEAVSSIEAQFTRQRPPLRTQVRALIVQLIESHDCSKERVASALHMHPRTLHRRLSDEGTCFEDVKDTVRRDIALGYLRATRLSVQRIAEKVGYAEHSVLTRSCARWFAASPRQVRKSGQG
jgi:AraC-like DNA-binding protein